MRLVFIHSSIKTRIETVRVEEIPISVPLFLYIVPLKQGLKQIHIPLFFLYIFVFIHSSIKTRIETYYKH